MVSTSISAAMVAGVVGAIGAERADHQQRQGDEVLRVEQGDDAEVAEREAEAEREDEADVAGEQRPFDRGELADAAEAERADQLAAAAGDGVEGRAPASAITKGSESRALAMTTTSGAAASGATPRLRTKRKAPSDRATAGTAR